jgi:DNA invertase Pin-like site-specific DNA recombinase
MVFYRDCGQSGATLDRPAMNALTADIRAGKIGAVIAADVARTARSCALASEWLDVPTEYGVTLVTLADAETAHDKSITYQPKTLILVTQNTIL